MSFGLLRSKVVAVHPKIASIISAILLTSFFVSIPVPANAAACVPTSTTASNGETILTFATVGSCDWEVPVGVTSVRVLVVGAGGGGGGGGNANSAEGGGSGGGGGGAGQVTHSTSLSVTPGSVTTISVGAGGAGGAGGMNGNTNWAGFNGSNGGASSAFSISSSGGIGGGGASRLLNTSSTDSGTNKCNPAANASTFFYVDGLPGFGGASGSAKSGGNLASCTTKKTIGAGGGGDTGAGANTGVGTAGTGTANSITDSSITYSPGGAGGAAGGASGATGANGAARTIAGSGGNGGAGALSGIAGNASAGANGVVIIRYGIACVPTSTTLGADTVVTFSTTGNCYWTVPEGVFSVRSLVVGAGGAGGGGYTTFYFGNGGGGGEVLDATISVSPGSTISVTVGAGGAATNYNTNSISANNGSSSSFGSTTARGGSSTADRTTRVGGTSGSLKTGGTGTNASGGATEGGGGGGSSANGAGRNGGAGVTSDITGTSTQYGGGGASMGFISAPVYGTATGGGGVPATYNTNVKGNGAANTGGGGGGDNGVAGGGTGGSGVVIVRYATPVTCSPTSTIVGTDTVLTFSQTGICVWLSPAGVTSARVLVVGGGGSGGGGISGSWFGAGGGGGEVLEDQTFTLTPSTNMSVGVGEGGIKSNYSTNYTGVNFDLRSGSPSVFGTMTARGGKSAINSTAAGGVSGNGRAGGNGAGGTWGNGGAGAGAAGSAQNPGAGVTSNISGISLEYGGGGNGNNGGSTGTARDGAGSRDVAALGNRGGGGSQMPSDSYNGGAGGSGVVIVRYSTPAGYSALSFDSNGGSGTKSAMILQNNTSTTVPDGTGFTNQGFEFTGWNTLANGTGTPVAAGGTMSISAATTLFAQWSRVPAPSCAAGVGQGGPGTSNFNTTKAGNGCVGISYKVSGVTTVATFNYTGADQSWTVPTGVTSATFYLIGAGGGGGIQAGGGGGYATGTYSSLTPGQVLTVIVGQGGGGVASATRPGVSGYPGQYTPTTYGGGGRGGSYGGATANWFASGGGRSAIRLANATEIATAAGGGGGAYGQCGFGGGGLSGLPTTASGNSGTGGTQSAGGTGGISVNGYPGTAGVAFQGGDSKDEGGGGGGGYFSGGGGGDNAGGPGGSSYIALLSNALTTAGGNCGAAALTTGLIYVVSYDANTATSGTVPSNSTVSVGGGTLTLASNSGTLAKSNYTFSGWNTAANGSGTTYSVGATTFSPSGDTTLYAQWNSTITYDANGATGTVPTAVVTKGSASATFALNSGSGLTRTGLSFVGWNTFANGTGTQVAGGGSYTSTGNATLYAIFRPTYTYNANGATGGTVPASTLGPIPGTQCVTDPGFNNCRVISYTGTNQTFTVPSDVDTTKGIMVEAWGAGGGGSVAYYGDPSGGAGGYSKAKINTVAAGDVLTVVVGQGGLVRDTTTKFGGGGAAGPASGANLGSSGGGYSGIFSGAGTTTPILISGGGGGGSPGTDSTGTPGGGGAASTTSTVQNGGQSSATNAALAGGRGGTNTAGGAGGTSNNCATAGSSLLGGTGCAISGAEGGGGGGGGYFGGGGGAYQTSTSGINGGGGGGSGFLNTTLATSVAAVKGPDGVYANFAYPDRTSPNYASNAGRGGMPNTNTAADNTGGNGLVTIQWSSATTLNPVAENTGNLVKTGYRFVGWNTTADGYGTSVPAGSSFPSSISTTLYATWEPDNTGLRPSFNTDTTSPIGVLANTAYVINTVYTNNANDLVLSQYADKIQIIATVPSGTLAITTTTNLTLPIGYQSALNTAAGTISFVGNLADVNTALATLRYTAAATAASTTITITASYAGINGDYRYNAATGSYYWRGATAVTREAALTPTTAASNCGVKFNNLCGYMTIPNNADESLFIFQKLGTGWIGISKPNHPTLQYVANAPSGLPTTPFTFWSSGEGTLSNEPNIAIYHSDGRWVDLSTQTYSPIYEFGGKSETVLFGVLTRTIAIGALVTTGTPTLDSASDTGTSSTDKITNDNTPTINIGGLTSGATITLTATPASGPAVTCTFVASSTSGSCTFSTLSDGTYSITATQSLGGTTTAASTALSNVVIDATRPTVTLTSSQIVSGGNRTATQAAPGLTNQIIVTFSENVSGFLISEITKAVSSTGWEITTTALTNATTSQFTFNVGNTTGVGGTAGTLILSILEGVASDTAGNTNTATASNFVINTLIQLTLTNEYDPCCVIGGNNELIAQTTPGGAITLPGKGTLTRAGHTFAGWSLDKTGGNGTVLGATFTPTIPVKLYSSWIPDVYVVSYNANGGNGAPTAASQSYTFGAANLALTTKGTLSRTGYTFGGWNTLATGLGTNYLESASYKPTASIILYAKWTAGTFAVTFNANGGAGTQMTNLSITAGTGIALTANTYTRAGYTFGGWNTLADGTGTAYANSASVTLFGDTTIYAQWVVVKPGAPSVTATSAGNTTATVTVTGAAVSGTTSGPATSYSIQTYANDGTTVIAGKTCTVLATASPLSCQITGLTNGTTYKFIATAINTTGSTAGLISTVTAIPAPFVVTYSLNGGTLTPTTANFNLGSPLTLPLPTRSGYTFAGWYAETGLTTLVGNDGAAYSPSANTTLYAKWTGVVYTITYNGNGNSGGTVPSSGSYTNGGTAYAVLDNTGVLVKTGYNFAGWYTNATGTGGSAYAAAASYSSAANIILFAKWDPVARTVTYNLGSGTGTTPTQLTGRFIGGTFATAEATGFSRSGFAFAGWSDGTNIYAANSTYTVGGTDVVLTAQWTAVSYSVTFLSNGATSGAAPTQANLTATQTFVVPANPFTKTGFNFTGWNDGTRNYSPGATYTMTAANTVLVAQWTARGYSITYDGNTSTGGSVPAAGNYVTGSPAYSVALNTFTKTGHVFTGWKTAADGTGTAYAPGAGYSSTADVILYAQWSAKSIAITFNRNGAAGTTPASATWTYNSTAQITLPLIGDLIKAGYTFGGWATSASATTGATSATPSDDTTYYAVWTLTDLAVTYTAGAGTGSVTGTMAKMGTTFTLAAKTGLVAPDPNGGCVTYTFATWAYNGATYKEGSSFVMGNDAISFEAQWTCVFNVRYTLNGGTGAIADVQKANNDPIVIGAAPTRDGYTFTHWVDQSGDSWAPGASTTVIGTRYLFFAVWTATPRTVTYALNGGSGTEPTALTGQTIGQIFSTATTSSTKAGYIFGGWNDGTTNYPAGSSYTINLANVTLTAVWNPATYTITYNGNGATGGATPSNGSFTTGGSYSIPANSVGNLVKAGFTFAGWSTEVNGGGTSYADAATTLTTTSDVILYAKWSAASYAVTYVLNGATSTLPTQNNVQYGSTFTLAAAATQTGKNFIGWSDGTNTYGGGATYTMGTAAVTLTASWQDQVYAVTYALNGGSGSAPVQSGLATGGTFTVATTTSTKAGYTFTGWNTGTANVSAGSTFTMTANNVTLTAVWTIAAPASPSSVSAVGGDGSATITVAASSSGGAPTSYVVTASPGTGTCTVISPATSCVILGLTNGTTYTFSATATNSTGTSTGTTSSSITPAGKPDAPTGVNAVSGNGSAMVSFTAPTVTGGPAITSYTVQAYDNAGNAVAGATCTVNAPATSCTVPGLTNGTAYTFGVTANNGLFTSLPSASSPSVVPATVPGAATSVAATSTTSGSATVTFTAPASNGGSAITGYTISSSPAGATCTVGANTTTYTCTGLTGGTAYTFAVVAVNSVGNSVAGSSTTALTTQGAASAPTTISAVAGDSKATVTFSGTAANGSTITGYTVKAYDSTGNEVSGATCTVTTAATNASCEVTGLTNGSSYTFKAITNSTANSTSVTSAPSIATAAITPAKVPDAPTGVQVTAGTGKISVSWTEPGSNGSAITSYTVQAYDSSGAAITGATCTVSAPATTCDVSTNLVAGSNYTFKVTATSLAGTSAASTASTSIAVNAAPSAPINVTAVAGNASATVSWDPPININGSALTGYTVTAYTAGNIVSGSCTTTASVETCLISGLTNGTAYTFVATATNSIGTSPASTASSAVTPSTVPNAPTAVSAAVGDAEATISFTAPANNGGSVVTGYTVTASSGATVSGTSSPIKVSGLTNVTAYTFTVTAANKNGDSVASVASASVTPVASSIPTLANDAQPTGDPYVGSTLTAAVTFNGSPTPVITYQWKVCDSATNLGSCTNIAGATSSTYVPTISEVGKYIVVDETATNRVGSLTETSSPTQVINPEVIFSGPTGTQSATVGTAVVVSLAAAGGVGAYTYTVSAGTMPAGVSLDPATGQISGTPTTAGTYTFTVRAADSNGVFKEVVVTITVTAAPITPAPPVVTPTPAPVCDADCQAARAAAASDAAATKAAADRAAADAIAKAAADKAAADKAAAAKVASDTAATTASTKAAADAAAAAAAAKAAVEKAAAAAVAQAAADEAAKIAAAQAKAAADAQATAAKAAADAAAALKNSTTTAAAKAAATASANAAANAAAAAVKAAATAAQQAAQTKTTAANANKQVDIAINSLTSKTAASQASAQANAIAAAAKAAASEAAAQAANAATAARAAATAAQKAAADTAARIATEQKQAADAAALAKIAADAAVKATADKIAATEAARIAAEASVKILNEKAALAEQAVKATTETAREEINKKIEEVRAKAEEAQKVAEVAATKADAAVEAQVAAVQTAEAATKEAQTQAAEAVAIKTESATKTAVATKAVAAATVAAKVATAAKEAAAKVPSEAVIAAKPSTSTNKNSATATVTGLKPGQKVKVTVNVKPKP